MGPGQTAESQGPGLGIVQGLEPGESWPAQPTLHPRRPGNRQVRGLLWILSPAPKGVRSQREGARPEPTGHRGAGVLGGAALARPLLLGSKQNLEEPRLAPSGPPGLDQKLWGGPEQVPSPGKDRVPPRQWPNRLCLPRQGVGERVCLQVQGQQGSVSCWVSPLLRSHRIISWVTKSWTRLSDRLAGPGGPMGFQDPPVTGRACVRARGAWGVG